MPYKTILVHADLSVHAASRIRLAARVAQAEGAHLIGAAMTGISRFVYAPSSSELARTVIAGYADTLCQNANQALAQFESVARLAGAPSWEPRLVADDPEGGLVSQSRFCDLLVLSQTDPAIAVAGAVRDLPEYVMLNVPRPVLLAPYAGECTCLDGNVLVAWNGSMEAARAVSHALPLLCRAARVVVVHLDAGEPGALAAQPAELLGWLARHGVVAELHEQRTGNDTGEALLALAADQQTNLIVMGGYGHTRFRELMLGGMTRTMLAKMTRPVLMSH
jgi:nucleotide-binding universal stress UspA family protein